MTIAFEKTRDVKSPVYSNYGAAALDFFVPNDVEWETKTLRHGDSIIVPSGIIVELPFDVCMIALNKSGLGSKGLNVGACLIDPDYRGEIHLNVFNTSHAELYIQRGEKLVQFIAVKFERLNLSQVSEVSKQTHRGGKGFGSTGKF